MTYNIYYTYNLIHKYKGLILGILSIFLSFSVRGQNSQDIQLANEYLLKGDKKKAIELYTELARHDANVPVIHNNYISTLIDLKMYDEAREYLRKLLRKDTENIQYKLDFAIVYVRSGDVSRADKYIKDLINESKSNVQSIKMMSDYLAARSLVNYSLMALKEARQFLGNPYLFSLDLAMLYRLQGEKEKMVQEYLTYVTQSSANIQYVKNVMQALLSKPEELESLEKILYGKVQKYPDVEVYSDLLIWVTMQQKNFYASFIQARAYDKRYKKDGEKSMEVARVALDNEDFVNAARIYRYVAKEYAETSNYLMARLGLIRTREAQIKSSYPVRSDSVKLLVQEYSDFIAQYPDNAHSLEAVRSKALLYATYLDEKREAIKILEDLIANSKTTVYLKSKAKLDLGDIYLIAAEPWESTLLYSQVEKTQRENTLGYEAKLKNAKLSYFKGDFKLAQEHLDILKEATTREIANDAMELSIRIKENISFDTLGEALREFASIELLLYQNKTSEALEALENFQLSGERWMSKEKAHLLNLKPIETRADSVLVKTGSLNRNNSITDDVYWLSAKIRMQQGEFQESIQLLQRIIDEFPDEVLADDAFFLQGEIYERQLRDLSKAMEIYREFLNRFPGSVYAAEARKRYRTLRGDFENTPSEFN